MTSPLRTTSSHTGTIAVCGNPNTGKTTIFNAITGLSQQVGNYPGVTVEKVSGYFTVDSYKGARYNLVDIPGAYSLAAISPDEHIAASALYGKVSGSKLPDAIICVLDATNLERSLYLLLQILQIGQPVVLALNMVDLAERRAVSIDTKKLSELLGGIPVVPVVGNRSQGVKKLKEEVAAILDRPFCPIVPRYDTAVEVLLARLFKRQEVAHVSRAELIRVLFDAGSIAERRLLEGSDRELRVMISEVRNQLIAEHGSLTVAEAKHLTERAAALSEQVTVQPKERMRTTSEKIDRLLLHRILGPIFLIGLMVFIFQSIFSWAGPFIDLIDGLFGMVGSWVELTMPDGPVRSLLVDGIIGGVGSVLMFVPQIAVLFFFIALLEDSGYMARGAFLVDRMFRWCGLSGKSFIPMLSSFACAVPGIMASRTIDDRKLRFITIMVAPLMTCSARLPVYSILITAFIPFYSYFGIFNSQGLVLAALYLLGVVVAVIVSFILNQTIFPTERGTFVMEMPSYKWPTFKSVGFRVLNKVRTFVVRAGSVILAITVVVWALSYYPRPTALVDEYKDAIVVQQERYQTGRAFLEEKRSSLLNNRLLPSALWYETVRDHLASVTHPDDLATMRDSLIEADSAQAPVIHTMYQLANLELNHVLTLERLQNRTASRMLRQSYFAGMGRAVEPAFAPLGWDWKITMAMLASFPAREVVIATMGTIFNMGGDSDTEASLMTMIQQAKWDGGPKKGQPLFTPAVALSVMVFFALCCQCGATLVTIRQETAQWRYAVFVFTYMTILAYVGALGVYQLFTRMGW